MSIISDEDVSTINDKDESTISDKDEIFSDRKKYSLIDAPVEDLNYARYREFRWASFEANEVIIKPGESSIRDRNLHSLSVDSFDEIAWGNLGNTMNKVETLIVNGSIPLTQRDIYLRALSIDVDRPLIWSNLGRNLARGERVSFHNGSIHYSSLTQRDIFLQVLNMNPACKYAWENLASTMEPGETISINGSKMTKDDVLLHANHFGRLTNKS